MLRDQTWIERLRDQKWLTSVKLQCKYRNPCGQSYNYLLDAEKSDNFLRYDNWIKCTSNVINSGKI